MPEPMTTGLSPGPDLDALVAIEIMGWVLIKRHWAERTTSGIGLSSITWVLPNLPVNDWHPSTNIADAWRVLEHLQPPPRDETWREFVHSQVGSLPLAHMTADEAALAICRAALADKERTNAHHST